jgi:hypothetical protein
MNCPGSSVQILSRDVSDHSPCVVTISTDIPKAKKNCFENYWLLHEEFMQVLEHGWNLPCNQEDRAKKLGVKFKTLRKILRQWHSLQQRLIASKERLGSCEFTHLHFDLNDLMEPVPDLHQLADPFTAAEIDSIINNLPNGKSPGPDGFNSDFMKKYWQIISPEFYDLYTGFYENNICLQSIN